MTLPQANEGQHKHPPLSRASLGEFGRNELAIVGAPCNLIRLLAQQLIGHLSPPYLITYADADHPKAAKENEPRTAQWPLIEQGAAVVFTDKTAYRQLDFRNDFNSYQKRVLCNDQDLVLVNGNHFNAMSQVVIIHPDKPLENKLEKLTDVCLIVLGHKTATMPGYLCHHLPNMEFLPVLNLEDTQGIAGWMEGFLKERTPKLNGLVLAGGQSQRMQADKGSLTYHGISQRAFLYNMLEKHCRKVFVSGSPQQTTHLAEGLPVIEDRFLGLGPLNGILSALQQEPDAAWLVAACDLPYLTEPTLQYLVAHRNPTKTATAFFDPEGRFPEPLLTIWEPRSYLTLLQMLSQGYNCPRKVLLNTDVEMVQVPYARELQNVNHPGEYRKAMQELQNKA